MKSTSNSFKKTLPKGSVPRKIQEATITDKE